MKKKVLVVLAVILLGAANVNAEPGDVFVEGRLGVGTTSPSEKLEVNGNLNVKNYKPRLTFQHTGGPVWWNILDDLGILKFSTGDPGSSLSEKMVITNQGNVGIGITGPIEKLEVAGNLNVKNYKPRLTFQHTGGPIWWSILDDLGTLKFSTGEPGFLSHRMVIDGQGNVGIGTESPVYELHVQGDIYASGQYLPSSDQRFKKDVTNIDSPLNRICNIRGVSFKWDTEHYKNYGFKEGRYLGVIAQDVERVIPEIVKEDSRGYKSVAYIEIIPVLIEAVKEQQNIIKKQQGEMKELKEEVLKIATKDYMVISQ